MLVNVCRGEVMLVLVSESGVKLIFWVFIGVICLLSVCVISCVFR